MDLIGIIMELYVGRSGIPVCWDEAATGVKDQDPCGTSCQE